MTKYHPWIRGDDRPHPRGTKNYIPSHERKGFSEKKVIKLAPYGEQQRPPGKQFVISRDKPLYKDRKS